MIIIRWINDSHQVDKDSHQVDKCPTHVFREILMLYICPKVPDKKHMGATALRLLMAALKALLAIAWSQWSVITNEEEIRQSARVSLSNLTKANRFRCPYPSSDAFLP